MLTSALIATLAAVTPDELGDFAAFVSRWEKRYPVEEYEMRSALFEVSKARVAKHNEEYAKGMHSWYMALNPLADATPEELRKLRSTYASPSKLPIARISLTASNPEQVDWRDKGAVTPVKNQGGCGSCWAFAATETVESHFQIASGKLLTLAPQTYVNCVENPHQCGGTGGCEGATMELAYNLTATSGIALEADLPYAARDETCAAYTPAVKAGGYVKNPENDALALETAIALKGPQSVTVAAEPWQLYGGGVFTGCSSGLLKSSTLDHGVQAVGYTKEYWIVRNSWGPRWGEQGYIYISRANDDQTFVDKKPADGVACKPLPKQQIIGGECGILFDTSYPVDVHAA